MPQSEASSGYVSGSSESRLQKAKTTIEKNFHTSIAAAAGVFKVKYNTLRNRVQGNHKAPRNAHEKQQLLMNIQTSVLIDWCKHKALLEEPYTRGGTSGKIPGQKWVSHFLQKHSEELEAGKEKGLDPKRARAFSKPVVTNHFKMLGDMIKKYDIPPENIYNKDEKGLQLGGGRKNIGTQFIFPHRMKQKMVKHSDSLQLMTILEAMCADGTALPTLMVLPDGSKPDQWWTLEDQGLGGVITAANGWTDNDVYLGWFKDIFLRYATPHNVFGKQILLISNGHGSHERAPLKDTAFKAGVILFSLPPHTTDQLQPLDAATLEGASITTSTFINEYLRARKQAMTKKCIKAAFRKTGIHPFNPNLFTDEDFAASLAWVPNSAGLSGYPHTPSSPESAMMTDETSGRSKEAETESGPETVPVSGVPMDISDGSDDTDYMMVSSVSIGDGGPSHEDLMEVLGGPHPTLVDGDTLIDCPTEAAPHPPCHHSPLPPPMLETAIRAAFPHPMTSPRHIPTVPCPTPTALSPHRVVCRQHPCPKYMWEQELALKHEEHVVTKVALEVTKLRAKAAEAQADAAAAHTTIQKLETDNLRLQLSLKAECKKSKGVNIHSRILTCPEGQVAWEELQQEEQAAKDHDKEADQFFDHPLMYYKKKEALCSLALALELDDNGKVVELQGCIKAHMQAHPELTTNPQFAGLYADRKTCATHRASQVSTVGMTPSTGSCSGVPQPPPEPLRLRPVSPPCEAGPSVGPTLMLGPALPQHPPNPPGNDLIPEVHPGHPWPPLVPGPNLHVPAEEWHWDRLTASRHNSLLSVVLAPGLGTHPHAPHAYPSRPYPPTSFHAHAGV
ncbi:hypothetical protein K439DRAFT_1611268 [Ramaria rubella]|nr:hypothetical protein K439DRAFT_1611268 [Ramaria rubella]